MRKKFHHNVTEQEALLNRNYNYDMNNSETRFFMQALGDTFTLCLIN